MTILKRDVTADVAGDIEALINQGRYFAVIGSVCLVLAVVAAVWLL